MKKLSVLAVCCAGLLLPAPHAVQAQAARPKLVVFLVFDQMRADYLVRYAGLYEHGLKRLSTQGAWYRNAAYPYLETLTCVGHTTIGTGTFPFKHGMIQNQWYDRETKSAVNCNTDQEAKDIPYAGTTGIADSAKRMMQPALAEVMRDSLKSRVATMSMKARSAIGLAGHKGDFVTWFGDRGAWETSSAYAGAPLPWFAAYVKAHPVEQDSDKTWDRALPADRYQFDDDVPGERGPAGWGAKFPHPLGKAGDAAYLAHWLTSPFSGDYLEEMAEAAVDELHLGMQDRIDFLGVSFSMLDTVGHAYGPRSHEVQDMLLRLDAAVGRLLDFLDKKVGAGNYVLALGSDHGVADIPDETSGTGGRVNMATVRALIEAAIAPTLGEGGPFIAAVAGTDVYFKPGVWDQIKSSPALAKAIAAAGGVPGVARVLTSEQVSSGSARSSKDAEIRATALSYYPNRSGDLFVIPKENWILAGVGTTHGTLYPYDQRVPVILYGAGIRGGALDDAVTPADLAPTIAQIVGVKLPSPDGKVLTSALAQK